LAWGDDESRSTPRISKMSDGADAPVKSLAPFFTTVKPHAEAFCNVFFSSVTHRNMIYGFLSLMESSGVSDTLFLLL
jgi:hypothetical protein